MVITCITPSFQYKQQNHADVPCIPNRSIVYQERARRTTSSGNTPKCSLLIMSLLGHKNAPEACNGATCVEDRKPQYKSKKMVCSDDACSKNNIRNAYF